MPYRELFEANPHPMWVYDLATLAFLEVNDAAVAKYGYSRDEFLTMTIADIRPPEDVDRLRANVAQVTGGLDEAGIWRHVTRHGQVLEVEIASRTLTWAGRPSELVLVRDVTERRRADARVAAATRLYAFLGQASQAIVRCREQDSLFGTLCRVAVDQGGFRLAWVGWLDSATGAVTPVAHAGAEASYLDGLSIRIGDERTGKGPTATALQSGTIVICDDIASDPRMAPWRDAALRHGFRSSAAIPFRKRGVIVGALNLYAAEPAFFTDEERRLLEEIGIDIGFALDGLDTELERRRAEASLRESERRLEFVLANSPSVVYACRPSGDFDATFVSRNVSRLLGYDAGEFISNPRFWIDRVHPEDARRVLDGLAQLSRTGRHSHEYRFRHRDGHWRWMLDELVLIRDANGTPVEILGTWLDITDRKRAEQALRDSEAQMRALFEAATDAVYVLDADGRIVDANTAAHERLGYTREELLSLNVRQIDHPDSAAKVPARFAEIGAAGSAVFEVLHTRKDGSLLPVEVSVRFVQFRGQPGYLSLARDVTDRKRAAAEREALQAQLAHAQKMEAVGRLAGGVAHDFNNMLAVILGRAEMALESVPEDSPLRLDLKEIHQAAERSAVLTRQLLAFARRQVVSPEVLDLNETVAGTLKLLRRLIGEDIALTFAPGADLWRVRVDPSQLDQVLANLIVNARDAIAGTGNITISTRNLSADRPLNLGSDVLSPGDYVLLRVRDDGCGMDEKTMAHLFEPFFTTKAAGKGTGLGLATVYGIVRQHAGYIEVRSAPGTGTTFDVYFPRVEEASDAARDEGEDDRLPGGTETVLLVEDEPAILALARAMLEKLGYRVLGASSPADAIALAEAHRGEVDLLITDVVMPGMNGHELAGRLAQTWPGLRCLYLSGYPADAIVDRGALKEGVRLIGKPFTVRRLADAVRAALDRS